MQDTVRIKDAICIGRGPFSQQGSIHIEDGQAMFCRDEIRIFGIRYFLHISYQLFLSRRILVPILEIFGLIDVNRG